MCSHGMEEPPKDERRTGASSRRSNKPLMEKRRRARINECLTQLKTLVLQAMKKDSTQYSKLEKADILEMTVKHLKMMQRQQLAAAMSTDPYVLAKYRAGFTECAGEIARYLESVQGVSPDVRARVLNHLATCMAHIPSFQQGAQYLPAHLQSLHLQGPPAGHVMASGVPIGQFQWGPMCVSAASMMPSSMASMQHPGGGFVKMEATRSPSVSEARFLKVESSFRPPGVKQERTSPDHDSPRAHDSPGLSESMDSESCMSDDDPSSEVKDDDPGLDLDLHSSEAEAFSPIQDLSYSAPEDLTTSRSKMDEPSPGKVKTSSTATQSNGKSVAKPRPVMATVVRNDDVPALTAVPLTLAPASNGQPQPARAAEVAQRCVGHTSAVPDEVSSPRASLEGKARGEAPGGLHQVAESGQEDRNQRPGGIAALMDPLLPVDGKMWRPW